MKLLNDYGEEVGEFERANMKKLLFNHDPKKVIGIATPCTNGAIIISFNDSVDPDLVKAYLSQEFFLEEIDDNNFSISILKEE